MLKNEHTIISYSDGLGKELCKIERFEPPHGSSSEPSLALLMKPGTTLAPYEIEFIVQNICEEAKALLQNFCE